MGTSGASEGNGPNRFKLRRGAAVISLERRDGRVVECLVSRKDFDRVRKLCPNFTQVKHENGNGLDNRRENLCGVGRTD